MKTFTFMHQSLIRSKILEDIYLTDLEDIVLKERHHLLNVIVYCLRLILTVIG